MKTTICLLAIFCFPLFSQISNTQIVEQLKKDKKVIKALNDLRVKQLQEINIFLNNGIDNKLSYDGKNFKVESEAVLKIYDIKEDSLELYEYQKASVKKESLYEFESETDRRPHSYLANIFKLGGVLSYNKNSQIVSPDIMLMYEFFSFDKLFNFYGVSLNIGAGLRHVGGTVSYQFLKTSWFRNTSLHLGYSYNFIDADPRPIISISLNF